MLSVFLTELYFANSSGKLPVGFHSTVCGKSLRCAGKYCHSKGITGSRVSGFYVHFSPEQHGMRRFTSAKNCTPFLSVRRRISVLSRGFLCVPAFLAMNGP